MRRYVIKKKRKFIGGGNTWTPQGAVENQFGMEKGSVDAQGNQTNSQNTGAGIQGGLLMTAVNVFGNTAKGFKADAEQTNADGTVKNINKAKNLSYAGAALDPLGIFSGTPAWKQVGYRKGLDAQNDAVAQANNVEEAYNKFNKFQIENPYQENQQTFGARFGGRRLRYAMGGPMPANGMGQEGMTEFNGGDGSPDSIGLSNIDVNDKETQTNKIIHSDAFIITPDMAAQFNIEPKYIGKTPAEVSKLLNVIPDRTESRHNEKKLLNTANVVDIFEQGKRNSDKRNGTGIVALEQLSKEMGKIAQDMQEQGMNPEEMFMAPGQKFGGVHGKKKAFLNNSKKMGKYYGGMHGYKMGGEPTNPPKPEDFENKFEYIMALKEYNDAIANQEGMKEQGGRNATRVNINNLKANPNSFKETAYPSNYGKRNILSLKGARKAQEEKKRIAEIDAKDMRKDNVNDIMSRIPKDRPFDGNLEQFNQGTYNPKGVVPLNEDAVDVDMTNKAQANVSEENAPKVTPSMVVKPNSKKSFGQAFAEARGAGKKTFTFNGKLYGTQLKSEVGKQAYLTHKDDDRMRPKKEYGGVDEMTIDNLQGNNAPQPKEKNALTEYLQLQENVKQEQLGSKGMNGYQIMQQFGMAPKINEMRTGYNEAVAESTGFTPMRKPLFKPKALFGGKRGYLRGGWNPEDAINDKFGIDKRSLIEQDNQQGDYIENNYDNQVNNAITPINNVNNPEELYFNVNSIKAKGIPVPTDNRTVKPTSNMYNPNSIIDNNPNITINNNTGEPEYNQHWGNYALQAIPAAWNLFKGSQKAEVEKPRLTSPRLVNVRERLRQINQNSDTSGNVARRSLLNANAGALATNIGATESAIQRNKGDQEGQAYEWRDLTNAGLLSQNDNANSGRLREVDVANAQNRAMKERFTAAAVGDLGKIGATLGKHINDKTTQDYVLSMMETENWKMVNGKLVWANTGEEVTANDILAGSGKKTKTTTTYTRSRGLFNYNKPKRN